jgi:hypothetical protein
MLRELYSSLMMGARQLSRTAGSCRSSAHPEATTAYTIAQALDMVAATEGLFTVDGEPVKVRTALQSMCRHSETVCGRVPIFELPGYNDWFLCCFFVFHCSCDH